MEIWKETVRTGYSVSSLGRVRNDKTGRFLKFDKTHDGYFRVSLGAKCRHRVHRLVALAFLDNEKGYEEVNHINEDKSDNSVENLEWCDRQQNAEHTIAKTWKFIDDKGEVREIFNLAKFCRESGMNVTGLQRLHKGLYNTYQGWKKYERT